MPLELNERQREAVAATEGPVLVIAGAGSGKTRVLTERILHLVGQKGVQPFQILAFTFTNRAAREMKDRLESRRTGITERLWVGTFHATGVRILRRHGEYIALNRNFSIYDAGDSLDLVKETINRLTLEGHVFRTPRSIRDQISRWKNGLVAPEEAFQQAGNNIERRIVSVYREYERSLRRANALDFDDLIARVVELFSTHGDIQRQYSSRFRYILVDEFQDTNPIQMAMIDALQSEHGNLFAVGDDDQSIYSWRGARVEHILNFENLYNDTRVIRLEQNYRSTQMILNAANHVIAHNVGRKGKNLWTSGEPGERVRLIQSMDEESEAMNVLHTVNTLVSSGIDLRNIAVLYRTNAQSRALEDVLKLGSLPYQIIGSVRFYERAEVRDILAYCKLIVNQDDNVSLKRILNTPKRGLGKATYERLSGLAAERTISVMSVLRSGAFDIGAAQAKRCARFAKLFDELGECAENADAAGVIERIVKETGYRDYLSESYPDGDSRIENVEELVAAADAHSERSEDRSLGAFLEEIALVADVDTLDETGGQLTLMTIHNAKGLEFDAVIVTGLEDGLFPHANSLDGAAELEEERRLFYVGMTRARKRLFCSFANMRRRMGSIEGATPSRFLYEIPPEFMDGAINEPARARADDQTGLFRDGFDTFLDDGARVGGFDEFSQEELVYAVGMRIHHNDFGRGVVRKVEGSGEDLRVTVIFDRGGERKFLAVYAPMRPIQ